MGCLLVVRVDSLHGIDGLLGIPNFTDESTLKVNRIDYSRAKIQVDVTHVRKKEVL